MPRLAEIEEPLRELTRDDVLFHWDKPPAKTFNLLKDMCCKAPLLTYYDVAKPMTIQCDASKLAVGAVLLQEGHPVAYASRKLRKSKLNWAPIEKEMMAIVFSTEKFREYILGKETIVGPRAIRDDSQEIDRSSPSMTSVYTELQDRTANELYELYAMIQGGWPDSKDKCTSWYQTALECT